MPVIKAVSAVGFTGAAFELASKWGVILACTYSALLIAQLIFNWVVRATEAYRVRVKKKKRALAMQKASAIPMAEESEFSFLNKKIEPKTQEVERHES